MRIPMNTSKMRYFDEWAKDKNPIFATFALEIAGSVRDCHELFESVKEGKRMEGETSLPRLRNWLKMYQNHEWVVIGVFSGLSKLDSRWEGIPELYRMLLKLQKMSPGEKREMLNEFQRKSPEERSKIAQDEAATLKKYQELTVGVVTEACEKGKKAYDGEKKRLN